MRTEAAWMRLVGPAMLALALGAGGVAAQEAEGSEPPFEGSADEGEPGGEVVADGGEAVADDEGPISGEGVEGEVIVTGVEDPDLPPGFCSACQEDGEIVEEVLAEASGIRGESRGETRQSGFGLTPRLAKAEAGSANLCASREHYVAWLCDWQGYSQP